MKKLLGRTPDNTKVVSVDSRSESKVIIVAPFKVDGEIEPPVGSIPNVTPPPKSTAVKTCVVYAEGAVVKMVPVMEINSWEMIPLDPPPAEGLFLTNNPNPLPTVTGPKAPTNEGRFWTLFLVSTTAVSSLASLAREEVLFFRLVARRNLKTRSP